MKYNKESTYVLSRETVENYTFEREFTFEDLKELINAFSKSKIIIESVVVREFGDYDEGPDVIRYKPSVIDQIKDDFAGKTIESYDLIGAYENREIIVNISTMGKRMQISYSPQEQDEIGAMMQELNEQDEKNNQDSPIVIS